MKGRPGPGSDRRGTQTQRRTRVELQVKTGRGRDASHDERSVVSVSYIASKRQSVFVVSWKYCSNVSVWSDDATLTDVRMDYCLDTTSPTAAQTLTLEDQTDQRPTFSINVEGTSSPTVLFPWRRISHPARKKIIYTQSHLLPTFFFLFFFV